MPPFHCILNTQILPVALQLPNGSYLTSADQALDLWDQVTVIQLESTLDLHSASRGLFGLGDDGKPERYLMISDDFYSIQIVQEDLSVESPYADVAIES